MFASIVFSPTCCALNNNVPFLFIVPASTLSLIPFDTAIGSPVIILSSINTSGVFNSVITPSTGTFSPIRTSIISPRCSVDKGTSIILPSSTTCATLGVKPNRERMAVEVLFLARSSNTLPVSAKVIIITEAS